MADRELTLKMIVQAIDRVTKPARQMGSAMGDMARRANLERLQAGLLAARERLSALGAKARETGKKLSDLGTGALTKVTAPLALIGGFALNAYGKMEQLGISFESMLGSVDAATSMVKKLMTFAASTPFQLEGIGASAKQLLAFGVSAGDIINRLTLLGNISAGANIPLEEMASIFGKAKAKGKAMTEELLQLSDRGVPIIAALAKGLGKTKNEIFTLASQGKISFDILLKGLQSMTAEGGIFHAQMQKQSQSLFGIYSTLKDNVFNALSEIGRTINEVFDVKSNMQALILWVQDATKRFVEFAKVHPELTKIGLGLSVIVAAAGPVLLVVGALASGFGVVASGAGLVAGGLGSLIAVVGNFITALRAGYGVMAAFNLVLAANPIGLVVTAIAALAAGAYLIYRNWKPISGFFKGLWDDIKAAFDEGFVQGVLKVLELFNPAIWVLKGANKLVKALTGIDLAKVGGEWIGGLEDGAKQKWSKFVGWLSDAVTGLMDWMPDWVKEHLGFDSAGQLQIPNAAAGAQAAAIKPAIGPQSGTSHTRVGGEIKVAFENAPTNMRVKSIKSDNPDVTPSVDAGYLMSGL